MEQNNGTFPILKKDEIIEQLRSFFPRELGYLEYDDLQTSQGLMKLYSVLVEDLVGIPQNTLFGSVRHDSDNPDLVKRAPISLMMGMQALFQAALITEDEPYKPSLLDLQPNSTAFGQKRLNHVLSGIINFKKFSCEINPLMDKICSEEKARKIREQIEREELDEIKESLRIEKERRAIAENKASTIQEQTRLIRQRIVEIEREEAQFNHCVEVESKALEKIREENDKLLERRACVDRELEYLRQKVVESPEALVQEANHLDTTAKELEDRLGRLYIRLSELEKASKDHKNILAFSADIEKELNLIADLDEKQQTLEQELATIKSNISGIVVDVTNEQREKLILQRQLMAIVDETSRNSVLERESINTYNKSMLVVNQSIEKISTQMNNLESKLEIYEHNILNCESTIQKEKADYAVLKKSTDEYITDMASKLRKTLNDILTV